MAIQSTSSNSVSISDSNTGAVLSGVGSTVLTLTSDGCTTIPIAPSTVDLSLSFPIGVTTAQVAFVKVVAGSDFKVRAEAAGTQFDIPEGGAFLVYNVTEILISSVNGGTIQFIVGG